MSDETVIANDEEPSDSEPVVSDEQPRSAKPGVALCPYCDFSAEGLGCGFVVYRHKRKEHPEEYAAEQAAKEPKQPKAETTARTSKPRGRARKSAAPKRDSPPRSAADDSPGWQREVRENVTLYYNLVGTTLAIRDPICGGSISQAAPKSADAWVNVCRTNEKARQFWVNAGGGKSSGWLELAVAHMPILQAVREHHVVPMMDRRREAMEAAMMEPNEPGDLSGEPVVYNTNGAEPPAEQPVVVGASPFTEGGMG